MDNSCTEYGYISIAFIHNSIQSLPMLKSPSGTHRFFAVTSAVWKQLCDAMDLDSEWALNEWVNPGCRTLQKQRLAWGWEATSQLPTFRLMTYSIYAWVLTIRNPSDFRFCWRTTKNWTVQKLGQFATLLAVFNLKVLRLETYLLY